ncbi:LamG-like jellyroll fold domain-containing protein [Halomonas sp. SSL-5]|uniref:LamG-like jellyroll fold domain-containing protein n=1 Tax=Halomonas sp. SSL-5 TaxID=3065855 RepID=UPI002738A33D|nr:LamG-like jellyroll fold domain-containing protein [Halomonas sp. SSL-5]MDY7117119.1 LamG-like jellyroll fold domain-containing protein [Halomonas sp. SSL-5]
MTVRLRWTDGNPAETGHRIYRDGAAIDPEALPTPLADIGPDIEQYTDDTAVGGQTHHYRVSAYVGSVEKVGAELVVDANGPLDPVVGNVNFYYKMDTLVGGEVVDAAGKHNALIRNGATQIAVGTGYAMQFDGSNDYLAIRGLYRPADATYPEFSGGCWFKTSSADRQVLTSFDRSEFYRLQVCYGDGTSYGDGTGLLGISVTVDTGKVLDVGGITRVDDDQWHLAVFTYDHGALTLYLDGRIEEQATYGTTLGPSRAGVDRYGFVAVGSEANNEDGAKSTFWFKGAMTKVFEMERVMTEDEVVRMYRLGVDG